MTPRNPEKDKILHKFVSNKVTELQETPGFLFRKTISQELKELSSKPVNKNVSQFIFDKIIIQFRKNTGTDPIITFSTIGLVLINPNIPNSRKAANDFIVQNQQNKTLI